MQDNYDPHNDLDTLRNSLNPFQCHLGLKDAVDRVCNWIDEAAWNTDQKFTNVPVPRTYEDARKEADIKLNKVTLVDELPSLDRQMNDVRNKNTALEMDRIALRSIVAVTEIERNNAIRANEKLSMSIETLRNSNSALLIQAKDHRIFAEGLQQGRQAAIDEAYKRGLREGRTEAREEFAHGYPGGRTKEEWDIISKASFERAAHLPED